MHMFRQFGKQLYLLQPRRHVILGAMTHRSISKIGFIGLGAMGSHMARNLLKKFKDVYVFDVNGSASQGLAKEGAIPVNQLDDLSNADCIVSMLPASQQVLDVYKEPLGLISKVMPGTLLIDSSTVDPEVPQLLSASAKQRNVTFVDAPVSGGVLAASSGDLTFMVGGSTEEIQHIEPVLRCMGKKIIHCGSSGSGQIAKICNNMLLAISMIAAAEAMNFGMRLGMDSKVLASVINSSSGRCWSLDSYNPVPGILENVPSNKNYQGGFMSRLLLKDLNIALSIAQRNETFIPFGEEALHIYKDVCDNGGADLDFSIVYQYIKDCKLKQYVL